MNKCITCGQTVKIAPVLTQLHVLFQKLEVLSEDVRANGQYAAYLDKKIESLTGAVGNLSQDVLKKVSDEVRAIMYMALDKEVECGNNGTVTHEE